MESAPLRRARKTGRDEREASGPPSRITDRLGRVDTHESPGGLSAGGDPLREAEEHLAKALAITRRIGDGRGEVDTLRSLGCLALARGEAREAFRLYLSSLELHFDLGGSSLGAAKVHGHLARAARACGKVDQAIVLGSVELAGLVEIGDLEGQRSALRELARSFVDGKERRAALASSFLTVSLAVESRDVDATRTLERWIGSMPEEVRELPRQALVTHLGHVVREATEAARGRVEDPYRVP